MPDASLRSGILLLRPKSKETRAAGTEKVYCLPIHARLHLPGKGQPSEATLAREMLQDVLAWFPDRKLVFLGDGAYSAKKPAGRLLSAR